MPPPSVASNCGKEFRGGVAGDDGGSLVVEGAVSYEYLCPLFPKNGTAGNAPPMKKRREWMGGKDGRNRDEDDQTTHTHTINKEGVGVGAGNLGNKMGTFCMRSVLSPVSCCA